MRRMGLGRGKDYAGSPSVEAKDQGENRTPNEGSVEAGWGRKRAGVRGETGGGRCNSLVARSSWGCASIGGKREKPEKNISSLGRGEKEIVHLKLVGERRSLFHKRISLLWMGKSMRKIRPAVRRSEGAWGGNLTRGRLTRVICCFGDGCIRGRTEVLRLAEGGRGGGSKEEIACLGEVRLIKKEAHNERQRKKRADFMACRRAREGSRG